MNVKPPRLLIFGARGFIGGHLAAAARDAGHATHIAGRGPAPAAGIECHAVDIGDPRAVSALVTRLEPGAIVNLAAISNVDVAERNPAAARAVNVDAAASIAAAGSACKAYVVYFSTDAVFAGDAEQYAEGDRHAPVNEYGRSKSAGEAAVKERSPGAGIVRISLTMGFPVNAAESFCSKLEGQLRAGQIVSAPAEEIRTPADAQTLAACILEMIRLRHAGALHLAGTQSASRAAIAREVASRLGFGEDRIDDRPANTPGRAPRHRRGVLSTDLARSLLSTPLLSLTETLDRAFAGRRGPA